MTMSPQNVVPIRRAIVVFATACVVISWGFWLVVGLTGGDVRQSPTIWYFAIGASGPSLAALVAVILVRRSGQPRSPVAAPWLWVPAALVLGALPAVVAALVLDGPGFGSAAPGVIDSSGGLILFLVTYLIAGPLAEEFGWRGYLQPHLRLRLNAVTTAVVLGAAWGVWHVPLFFLNGSGQHAMGLLSLRGLLFFLSLIPLSFTYLWVFERLGGAVWSAILLHFAGNSASALLPQTSDAGALLQFGVTLLIALVLLAASRFARERSAGSARVVGDPVIAGDR